MKAFQPGARVFAALLVAALFGAGCAGSATSPTSGLTPNALHGGAMHPADGHGDGNGGGNGNGNGNGSVQLIAPLSFDGLNFYIVSQPCNTVDLDDATPWPATTSGALVLTGPVNLTPACNTSSSTGGGHHGDARPNSVVITPTPSPVPTRPGNVYIVAYALCSDSHHGGDARHVTANDNHGYGSNCHSGDSHHNGMHANDDGNDCTPTIVAGPVNLSDAYWTFAPVLPGLTEQAGTSYAFFIAVLNSDSSGHHEGH